MDINTLCVHGDNALNDRTGAVSVPIYQSATFAHPAVGQSTGYDYSRVQNPTREHLEKIIAALEYGTDALAFASGMAAIACLTELFRPGDHIVASDDLYGGSIRLFNSISLKNGLTFDFADTSDPAEIERYLKPETKAVFVETPTNPMMKVTDIAAVSQLTREKKLLLIIDNTFLTPYFQQPLSLGADIVVHSGTKYLGGHNDTLAGFLVTNRADLSEKLRYIFKTVGSCLSPFDSWLIIRGIKTLAVRMLRQQETAMKLAGWLRGHRKIKAVACKAAYSEGGPWLDELKAYITENLGFLRRCLNNKLSQIRLVEPEGTYLVWLDFKALNLSEPALEELIVRKAKLWLDGGAMFGSGGAGFQRINIACPRATLEKALVQLVLSVETRGTGRLLRSSPL